jgi:hypothetical protein
MQRIDAFLQFSATELGCLISCRDLTALAVEAALGRRAKPPAYADSFLEVLPERGLRS